MNDSCGGQCVATAERRLWRVRPRLAVTAAVWVALAAGCSTFKSGGDKTETEHKPGGKLPPLEISPDLYGAPQDRVKPPVATSPKTAPATLQKKPDGAGVLSLSDQFERAWRRVGLALDRMGFPVDDRDRSRGRYLVRFVDPDAAQSRGFFSRLNPFSSAGQPSKEQYRIQLKEAAPGTEVNVLDKDGNEDKSDTANRILTLLYEELK